MLRQHIAVLAWILMGVAACFGTSRATAAGGGHGAGGGHAIAGGGGYGRGYGGGGFGRGYGYGGYGGFGRGYGFYGYPGFYGFGLGLGLGYGLGYGYGGYGGYGLPLPLSLSLSRLRRCGRRRSPAPAPGPGPESSGRSAAGTVAGPSRAAHASLCLDGPGPAHGRRRAPEHSRAARGRRSDQWDADESERATPRVHVFRSAAGPQLYLRRDCPVDGSERTGGGPGTPHYGAGRRTPQRRFRCAGCARGMKPQTPALHAGLPSRCS